MSGLFDRNVPGTTEILATAVIGIAGCGGLGSNAAVSLVRAGVGRLILADHDVVEESNLNRQQYYREDLGRRKVEALGARLLSINPNLRVTLYPRELTPAAVPEVFAEAQVLIEAFDRAERKVWLIQSWCRAYPERLICVASGLSGLGRTSELRVRRSGRIIVGGDETSEMTEGLCAPRVAIVANMLANEAVAWLCRGAGEC